MNVTRRSFVAGAVACGLSGPVSSMQARTLGGEREWGWNGGAAALLEAASRPAAHGTPGDGFDPWIEVDVQALAANVEVVRGLARGRPILAVVKNNAYGLGLLPAGRVLAEHSSVWGLAVVKADEALALRNAGIAKPILLMGLFSAEEGMELVARGVDLALFTDDAVERVAQAARRAGRPARVHLYVDTGMSRMGMPYHRAVPWAEDIFRAGLRPISTFTELAEEGDFDREQVRRLLELARTLRGRGMDPGLLHAASSHGLYHLPDTHLDMVRPGISLFGAYPSNEGTEKSLGALRPAFRLKTRVVRVERLRAGDGVGYGRPFTTPVPLWIATLPVGHCDGYPREAVKGARVLVGGRLYPVVGTVSASHTLLNLGEEEPRVKIGDTATLLGPEHEETHPNVIAVRAGRSVYDVLMHLSPLLPRRPVEGGS